MKLKHLIQQVDTTGHKHDVDVESVAQTFDINFWGWDDSERMVEYAIKEWCCTDTWVGLYVIFLDGVAVGISNQDARKSRKEYKWLDEKSAEKVKNYCLSLVDTSIEKGDILTDKELEWDWGRFYQLSYSSQILGKTVWYRHPDCDADLLDTLVVCEIVEKHRWSRDCTIGSEGVKIRYNDEDIVVSMKDVYFPYNVR